MISLVLTLVLGGGVAHYLISLNTYSEMESRIEQASDGIHTSIYLLFEKNIHGYLKGVADSHLELIKLLDEAMGEAGKERAAELMLRQKIGRSGYMVAIDCSNPDDPKTVVHPNPELRNKGKEYFPFIVQECVQKTGLFEFVLNVPGIHNKPKSIWLNYYEPWQWIFGPAPFKNSHYELIEMDELRPYLEQLNSAMQGEIFIMDPMGNVLFHPDYEGQNVTGMVDAKSGRPFIQTALQSIRGQIHQSDQTLVGGGARFYLEDLSSLEPVEYIARYRYMPETGWIIGVMVKTSDIGLPTSQLALALLLVFIFSSVFMTWLLNRMSRPFFSDIDELNRAVRQVGEGHFDIEILSSRDDELGDLSLAFGQMAKNLAESHRKQARYRQELEDKVRERTQRLREQNSKLERLSVTDCLTCVGNRRHFDQVLYEEIMRANRTHTELCLMILDVDHFKAYNDRYGHPAGDECLKRVAYVMTQCAQRSIDVVARYGGEEFSLVSLDTNLTGAKKIAEHIQQLLEEQNIEHLDSPLGRVTVSIGICVMTPDAGFSPEAMIEAADAALYKAKEGGRNRVEAVSV